MLNQLIDHGHNLRVLALPRSATPLHCMAISAGYEQRLNEVYSWDGLQRGTAPFLVIQHTLVGEGRLDFAGTQYRLTPGQTMVLSLPHAHRYWLERGGHWEYFWMVLNGREALRLAREIIDAAGPVVSLPASVVDRLAGACDTLVGKPDITPGEASSAAYAAMAALHDGVFGADAAPERTLPAAINRVIAHVEANLARPLPVERLAAIAEMSRGHFVRQFGASVGTPPSDFVLERRIERIERLLLATDMSVVAISRATGFADANYLAKAFRRKRGLAPLEFRAQGRLAAGA
ncbi:AraC family transcriptional regulator [Devosia ginsengisoli]|uniref:Helix-turn-helix domain-containing protein n=1 Tax=Devosia ginsengisoli TaxID=400770 RepID=A0A5B8LS09_9HYPH|nr:helix-turn-helix domain-containing protein [Devosia ginsengisoli]QDZ11087.1 helix-turn-helix domain-containing protein [Devosia ginsengisoli]